MTTKYGVLPDKSLEKYYSFLIGQIYKILPMKEENCQTLQVYLEGLMIELLGNQALIEDLKDEPQFITLIEIIQYFMSNEYDVKTCRTQVFRAINIVKKINKKYIGGGASV